MISPENFYLLLSTGFYWAATEGRPYARPSPFANCQVLLL